MSLKFHSLPMPPAYLIEQVAASDPTNPFCTPEYESASKALGEQPRFIGLFRHSELVSGCIGFLSGSLLLRSLTIPSLPNLPSPEVFWRGLVKLCRDLKVWRLQIDTYCSQTADIPRLPGELTRRPRREYVLDLEGGDVLAGACSQHRRNISRAAKAGLSIRRTREVSACALHVELMKASMDRRSKRGEEVGMSEHSALLLALLASRSGELFQAANADRILSSILILKSTQGAYYQTAGTLPEGMSVGASPFLISSVATTLKEEGLRLFNLGGATDDNPGLLRFKAGFGTREVSLEAASFCPKSAIERKVHSTLRTGWSWIRRK